MKHYLVGGAVRDQLLGIPVIDHDWVVVGSTPDDMLKAGFKSVGKDFPVFLHPDSHEEYALARVERKTGPGYHGFEFSTDASVTLEEDLSRRDLTINAIAQRKNGELVDPFNGKADIENRVLRHVSKAFVEDPVRILRIAKFMARFSHLGFTIADETLELMRHMVDAGEVDNLVPERIWQEMQGALLARTPGAFFQALRACGALAVILPEVDALFGVPQPAKWHPEIDSGIHTLMVLEQAALQSTELDVRFAALCHDLGKATTPTDILPSHHGHEERGARLTETLCERLRVPKKTRDIAVLTARWHTHCHRSIDSKASKLVKLLQSMDVVRKPERFEYYLQVCKADARGRLGQEQSAYPQADFLRQVAKVFLQVDTAAIARATDDKSTIAARITEARVNTIKQWLDSYPSD
ncbi:multifunctional CCA addition/repair protein [Granulosicoccus antarcticus]|uniref:Multifunctional CCA protein n=1 Tax=Granulosicoccus antarcticus IMCC3135 TaxID=1192854 RepID=A0A2Z2NIK4_9GAMM|nr:multifunctional CCA addition/repair protein [Granulosicoccus antarcticus]ASJ71182.1 Multifunctional CCA protein [Granulosicoccus antarcticus IMCC3135]